MTIPEDLLQRWHRQWHPCDPIGHDLRGPHRDRWVRFHSLPESQRYADTEAEYRILLHRYNTVLDELFADEDVYLLTPDWNDRPDPDPRPTDHAAWHPAAEHWTSVRTDDDPEYLAYTHLYLSRVSWRPGCLDELLRAVADDRTAGVLIMSLDLTRLHHPYDGGQDIFLPSTADRDALRDRHAAWLSQHPGGY
ncbi:DUF3885 domain-containing protein [Crossiella sp. CA198]|uniref:DUF3885 domain-containing protein n=1 Tax=Crossiella sp. CA198 TaxID=3455607 RepID=UPI003F8D7113